MTGQIRKFSVLAFTVLLTVSMFAPAVGASMGAQADASGQDALDAGSVEGDVQHVDNDGVQYSPDESGASSEDGGDGVVADGLEDADGTVQVVARLTPAAPDAGVSAATAVQSLRANAQAAQESVTAWAADTAGASVVEQFWLANAVLLEVDTDATSLDELASVEGVEVVHPNYEFSLPEPDQAATTQNASDYNVTYGLDQIDAPEVWDEYDTMGSGVEVAVLDTGVYDEHPDIQIEDENFVKVEADGSINNTEPYDSSYHGTHVSGTVSGGNASGTYIGVAPNVTLMHGLVIPGGSGSFTQIISGMEWAVEEDADVISMSLGATGYYPSMIEPVQNAQDAGSIVVSSSGNAGEGTSGSPANVYDTYAVGASNETRGIAAFSSGEPIDTDETWSVFAPDYWPEEYVVPDVSAPGVNVTSAIPPGFLPGTVYGVASGTSMAAPHVSGAIALMQSAAGEDLTVDQIRAALSTTATKPSGAPGEKDHRYGEGIIDVESATDRVAAPSGVTGTVTDADGDPIEGATVTLDGYPTWTDANGEYTLHAEDGTYEVAVEAFGYETASREVTVSNGSFVTENFTLDGELAVEVTDGQPDGAAVGESFDVTAQVAGAESLTVEQVGNYSGDVTLEVDGTEYDTGEEIVFDSPVTGEVTVTVETADEGTGHLELAHTFAGAGDSVEAETGPTVVFEEWVDVAVVDTEGSEYGDNLAATLRQELHPRFRFSHVTPADAVDAAEDGDYDGYVVQNFTSDDELLADFVAATETPDTGVVFLDQYGSASESINRLSAVTGDPASASDAAVLTDANGPVSYEVTGDHPILDGVAEAGDSVDLYTPTPLQAIIGTVTGFHTYFEEYDGIGNAETVADVQFLGETSGSGLAADSLSRTVLAASLGHSSYVGPLAYEDPALDILANSVEYATAAPAAVPTEMPPERVAPGDQITTLFDATNLEEVNVEIAESSGLTSDDLSLYVNGKVNAFGEWRAYDPPLNGELNVTVMTDASIDASDVSLEVTVRTEDGDETTLSLPRTAVYEPPLEVPSEVESIDDAVDIAVPGEEIVVADGVYQELSDQQDGFTDVGVWVDKAGITLRAADGATPKVVLAEEASQFNGDVVRVEATDVTIDGLNVNTDLGGEHAVPNGTYHMGLILDEASNVTVEDVDLSGNMGLRFESDVTGVDASNVRTRNAFTGVGTDSASSGLSDVAITDSTVNATGTPSAIVFEGISLSSVEGLHVADTDVEIGESVTGVYTDLVDDATFENVDVHGDGPGSETTGVHHAWGDDFALRNSTVENVSTGVEFSGFIDENLAVEGNHIENAETGVRVLPGPELSVTENTVDAEHGISYTTDFDNPHELGLVDAQYNDLSASAAPFHLGTDVTGGESLDARLNYVGERNATDAIVDDEAAEGDVMYDPFLTAPPSDVDMDETTQIGTDLRMDAGEMYAVGVPGPVNGTLADMLAADFQGAVYGWDATSQSWEMLTGNASLDALDAVLVAADSEGRMTMNFQSGDSPSSPGVRGLETGWNFVASPQYTTAYDAFDVGTAEPSLLLSMFEEPDSQLGPKGEVEGTHELAPIGENPNVSAFAGYFVYMEDDGTIPAYLYNDVTIDELYDELGLEYEPSSADATADIATLLTEVDDEERATAAVTQVLYDRMETQLADTELTRDSVEAVAADVIGDALDSAPDSEHHVVDAAAEDALRLVLQDELGVSFAGVDEDIEESVQEQQDAEDESNDDQQAIGAVTPVATAA